MGRQWPPFSTSSCLRAWLPVLVCRFVSLRRASLQTLHRYARRKEHLVCTSHTEHNTLVQISSVFSQPLLLAPIQSVILHFGSGRIHKTKSIWLLILVIYFDHCGSTSTSSISFCLFILSFFLLTFQVFAILMLPSMCCCNVFLLEIHQFFLLSLKEDCPILKKDCGRAEIWLHRIWVCEWFREERFKREWNLEGRERERELEFVWRAWERLAVICMTAGCLVSSRSSISNSSCCWDIVQVARNSCGVCLVCVLLRLYWLLLSVSLRLPSSVRLGAQSQFEIRCGRCITPGTMVRRSSLQSGTAGCSSSSSKKQK